MVSTLAMSDQESMKHEKWAKKTFECRGIVHRQKSTEANVVLGEGAHINTQEQPTRHEKRGRCSCLLPMISH